MVAEFVVRTAEWMRGIQIIFEAEFIGQSDSKSCIVPCYTLVTPSRTWGEEVTKLEYDKLPYTTLSNFNIIVDSVLSVQRHPEHIRFPDIVDGGDSGKELALDDADYDRLCSIIYNRYDMTAAEDARNYIFAYRNPYWGGDFRPINNDQSLCIALQTLRVRGKNSVVLFVSLKL